MHSQRENALADLGSQQVDLLTTGHFAMDTTADQSNGARQKVLSPRSSRSPRWEKPPPAMMADSSEAPWRLTVAVGEL